MALIVSVAATSLDLGERRCRLCYQFFRNRLLAKRGRTVSSPSTERSPAERMRTSNECWPISRTRELNQGRYSFTFTEIVRSERVRDL
jgi:hypothetical protein